MEEPKRNSFVFYQSYYDCINELPEEYKLKVLMSIINYGLNGIVDESNPIVKAILVSVIPMIDGANNRYEKARINGEKGKEYGALGGRPKKADVEQIPVMRALGFTPQKISEKLRLPIKVVYKYYNQETESKNG